jgi:hypothetical protein
VKCMYLLRAMHPKWSSFYISENPYLIYKKLCVYLRTQSLKSS